MVLKWFSEINARSFWGIGEYFEGEPIDFQLLKLLNVEEDDIKPFTKNLLDANELSDVLDPLILELRRGLHAYFQFQDILSIHLEIETPNMENRHYCYYESIVYLRESIISWLDRNVLAALTLLRPFLELSILHLYWMLINEKKGAKKFYLWIQEGKGKPNFTNALNYVFGNLPTGKVVDKKRLNELKQTIKNIYKDVLCSYNHTPRIDESITAKGGGPGNLSLESFFYALHITNMLLRDIVYLYILAYPMSLFPVEIFNTFGFSGPVGIFFDRMNFSVLQRYIGEKNTDVLHNSFTTLPDVESLLDWVNDMPKLSEDEKEKEWEDFRKSNRINLETPSELGPRIALFKANTRTLGWFMNYITPQQHDDEISDELMEKLRKRVKDW